MHSFLLIGQSNMAGRGEMETAPPITNDRLYVMRNARWQKMYRPVNPDRPFSGVNLAERFAERYSDAHPSIDVGLIPCADGGTSLAQWAPGSLLFDHAVMQAKLAMRTSHLCGVLWHQGESDCSEEASKMYGEKLTEMLESLRRDLGMPELPVMLGALGDYLSEYDEGTRLWYPKVNAALQDVARHMRNVVYVPAEGLTAKADHLHFNTASLMLFGERYFDAYSKIQGTESLNEAFDTEDGVTMSEMELL